MIEDIYVDLQIGGCMVPLPRWGQKGRKPRDSMDLDRVLQLLA
jgi:hypothetical protein